MWRAGEERVVDIRTVWQVDGSGYMESVLMKLTVTVRQYK